MINMRLMEVYHSPETGYRAGWTDARVSRDLGYPQEQVAPLLARALLAAGEIDTLLKDFGETRVAAPRDQAVILAALVIRFTGWTLVDPILAVLIGLWVLPRTWVLLRDALNVLLEGVPKGIALADVEQALRGHAGVTGIHDLHVWALGSSTPALTAHVVTTATGQDADTLRRALAAMLHERFGIDHVTLQVEADHCGDACAVHARQGAHDDGHDHSH